MILAARCLRAARRDLDTKEALVGYVMVAEFLVYVKRFLTKK